jgi:hypothetical protein
VRLLRWTPPPPPPSGEGELSHPGARLCEGDTEQEISLEELEEVTLNEASALRACP